MANSHGLCSGNTATATTSAALSATTDSELLSWLLALGYLMNF